MRFYDIKIYDPISKQPRLLYGTTKADGSYDPSALRVYFEIPFYNSSEPAGMAYVKIYGVNYIDIKQSAQITNGRITMLGGMFKGLPLVNTQQQGTLLEGSIYQAFGNWQGNEISLDLVAQPPSGTEENPIQVNFIWKKGENLSDLVARVLTSAYPGKQVAGNYSSSLITNENIQGYYYTLNQFARWVKEASQNLNPNKSYLGAQITQVPSGFKIYDGSSKENPKQLDFKDFIGNATYTKIDTINFKLVLRADLMVGDFVRMPKESNIANVVNSFTQFRDKIAFKNIFIISSIRHLGDSRQTSAESWCSVVDAIALPGENIQ